jgi:rhamnosyltransferase subunit B
MRIFMMAIGSLGDANPIISLGLTLQRRGHEVFVLTTADSDAKIRSAGLNTHVVLSQKDFDAWRNKEREQDPDVENTKAFVHVALPAIAETVRFVWKHKVPGQTIGLGPVVLTSGLMFLREKFGIPVIELQYAPRPKYDPQMFDVLFGDIMGDVAASIGLVRDRSNWLDILCDCDRVIGLYPDWFLDAADTTGCVTAIPTNYLFVPTDDAQALPDELSRFLDAGAPPLAVTFGSYATTDGNLFEKAIEACGELRQRLVIITKYPEQLPSPLPEHCINVGYVSLQRLFPRLCAVIHHGGAGTIAQAFRAGTPQIVCPMAFDQFINADRVAALGCGSIIDHNDFHEDTLARVISDTLCDPMIGLHTRNIAARFDSSDSSDSICDTIEAHGLRLLAGSRSTMAIG